MFREKGFSQLLALLCIVIILSLVGGAYYLGKQQNSLSTPQADKSSLKSTPLVCNKSGFQPKQNYLTSYAVKKGDSLLSIARDALLDKSRVNELVEVNKEFYPKLSLENPFLEEGWKLYLPPKEVTNGLIYVISGNLSITDKGWGVSWNNGGAGPFALEELKKFKEEATIKSGDCVTVLYQGSNLQENNQIKVILAKGQ